MKFQLLTRTVRREAEQIVEEARAHFSARSLAVESHIAEGNPANEILMSLKSESTT